MKVSKRVVALLLVLVFSLTPIGSVYANRVSEPIAVVNEGAEPSPLEGEEPAPSEGEEPIPSESGEPTPSESEGPTENPTENTSEPTEAPKPSEPAVVESDIQCAIAYGSELVSDKWYTQHSDLFVEMSNTVEMETAKVTVKRSGEAETVHDLVKDENPYWSCTTPILEDGIYDVSVYAKDVNGTEFTYDVILHIDTTAVDYSNVRAEGLNVVEDVGYAVNEFTLSGIVDKTSGIKSIALLNKDMGVVREFGEDENLVITSDVVGISFEDVAGNMSQITVLELLNGICSRYVFDAVEPILSIAKDRESVYEKDGVLCYNGKLIVTLKVFDDNLHYYKATVNGTEVALTVGEDGNLSYTGEFEDGVYAVSLSATDRSGNTKELVESILVDTTVPTLGSISVSGEYVVVGSNIVTSGSLTIDGLAEDINGLSAVEVYKGEVLVASALPFEITESGSYSVKVSDVLGNTSTFSLSDLLGKTEIIGVVLDTTAPALSVYISGTKKAEGTGTKWYTEPPVIAITSEDEICGVSSYEWSLTTASGHFASGTGAVNTDTLADGKYHLHVESSDLVGNISEKEIDFNIDRNAPALNSIVLSEPSNRKGGNLYFTDSATLTIEGTDAGVGTVTYLLYCDGELLEENLTGKFTISQGGKNYYVVLSDGLDFSSSPVYVAEYLNISASNIIFNYASPVLNSNLFEGAWVNSDCTYSVKAESDIGIDKVEISINGNLLVNETYSDVDTVSVTKEVSTAGIDANEDMSYILSVRVTDNSGRTSEFSDTVYVDKAAPDKGSLSVAGVWNLNGDRVYTKDRLVISGEPVDVGSGIRSVEVLKDGEIAGDIPYYIVQSGAYSVRVTDNVGNVGEFPISELLGTETSYIVVDNEGPVVQFDLNNSDKPNYIDEVNGVNWYISNPRIYVSMVDENLNSVSVSVTVDGTENIVVSDILENNIYAIDTVGIDGREFVITARAVDKSGNEVTDAYTFRVDKVKPDKGDISVSGTWELHDGKMYTNGVIGIDGTPVDTESGIKSIEVLKDGAVVGSLPYNVTNSGAYSVRVVDRVGNVSTFSLAELAGVAAESVIVDLDAPSVEFDLENSDKPAYSPEGGTIWYSKNPIIRLEITDDNLQSVDVKVNVDGVETDVVSDISADGYYAIDTSSFTGKVFTITASAVDKSGTSSFNAYSFNVDVTKPNKGTMNVTGNWEIHEGRFYTKTGVKLEGYPEDTDSGIKSVDVLKDGTVVGILPYAVVDSGEYSIRVTDNVGNVYTFSMSELTGIEANYIIVDGNSPIVMIDKDKSDKPVYDNWYQSNPVIYINMTDDNMQSVTVTVNIDGKETTVISEVVESGVYTVDTSTMSGKSFVITATATDKSGNTSFDDYSFLVDKNNPTMGSISVTGSWEVHDGKFYINEALSINGYPEDLDSGVKTVELIKDGEVDGTLPYTILESGEYSVKVTDYVGNVSVFSLKDMTGVDAGAVVFDNGNPSVRVDIGSSDQPVYVDEATGIKWYQSYPTIYIDMTDDHMNSVTVTVSVDGKESTAISSVEEDGVYVLDTSKYTGRDFIVTATAVDKSGNIGTDAYSFSVDTNNPLIGDVSVEGTWELHDDKMYTKGIISIKGSPVDGDSGIKSIEVYNGEQVVGTLPYSIIASGIYSVKVTDNVGNVSEFTLKDISGTGTSEVVWDQDSPLVYFDGEKSDKPQYIGNSINWFASNPKLYVGMNDTNLESVSVSVVIDGNETIVVNNILDDGIYAIDTSYAQGKDFVVTATARDKSGNITTVPYQFKVDSVKPDVGSIGTRVSPELFEVDNYVYIRGNAVLSGVPADGDSGIESVSVYKDGTQVFTSASLVDVVIDNEEESGYYEVEIIDNVGNINRFGIGSLLGTESDNVVIDLTSPVISRTDSNEETKSGWYNYAPVLSFDVSDTYLREYKVYVNDDMVHSGSQSESFTVDTVAYLNMNVSVRIEVVDKAGNTASYRYEYKHDNTPPKVTGIDVANPVSQKGSNVYFNSEVNIIVHAEDAFYGEFSYYLNESVGTDGKYTIGADGEYYVKLVDGLGNSTGLIKLSDIAKWSGNNIVIDNINPIISSNKYDSGWFDSDKEYNVVVSDDKGLDSVVISINDVAVVTDEFTDVGVTSKSYTVNTSLVKPKEDGSYVISVHTVDNAKLSADWSDTVYVDTVNPYVEEFIFGDYVNNLPEGAYYSYFFNGNGYVDIVCKDSYPSSGLESLWVKFGDGEYARYDIPENGVVNVKIPDVFKGIVSAYTVDMVGNKSDVSVSTSIISETSKKHVDSDSVIITLPETQYLDANGLPLYSTDIIVGLDTVCGWSGIKEIVWGYGSDNHITDFTGGEFDNNVAIKHHTTCAVIGNENDMTLSASATSWTGYIVGNQVKFSIDKDVPVISVTFDKTVVSGYYNTSRVANVTVKERNFDPALVKVTGDGTLGSWSNDGDNWYNTLTFSEDGDYKFTIDCTDRAGNVATQYVSEEFTVDKTIPVMSVSWDNNDVSNGMYYGHGRIATITITEHNFDSASFALTGTGSVSQWSNNGDTHSATIVFNDDGVYEFSLEYTDKAGNKLNEVYNSERFIIDTTYPEVEFERISQGVSYKGNVEFLVSVTDTYVNSQETRVYLEGKNFSKTEITGQFVGQSGTFSYTDFPEVPETDDIYTITVHSVDQAGNVTEKTLTFSVNRFGSSYSFYDAEYLGNYLNESKGISITEVNTDKLDTSKVVVSIVKDGKDVSVQDGWVSIEEKEEDGKFVYTYFISKDAFAEDGKYSVSVKSQAEEGTVYTCVAEQYDFVVDKTQPVVIISGIEEGKTYKEYFRKVAVDVRDLSGIKAIQVLLNGKEVSYTVENGMYTFDITENSDFQNLQVNVTDLADNISTVAVDKFLITSNLFVYLINQTWFIVSISVLLFVIIVLIILLLSSRRKEKDEEQEALIASGELYKSSTAGSSSGSSDNTTESNQILSGDAPSVKDTAEAPDDAGETSVMDDGSDSATGYMDDSDDNTGMMDDGDAE